MPKRISLANRLISAALFCVSVIFGALAIMALMASILFVFVGYYVEDDEWYSFEHYSGALAYIAIGAACALVAVLAELGRHVIRSVEKVGLGDAEVAEVASSCDRKQPPVGKTCD